MLNLLDDILGALSQFDLITPTWNLLETIGRGGGFTFRVPHRSGYGIYTVKKILQQAGCNPVWGLEIFDDMMLLKVKHAQAQRGYWALHKAHVPMENQVPGKRR